MTMFNFVDTGLDNLIVKSIAPGSIAVKEWTKGTHRRPYLTTVYKNPNSSEDQSTTHHNAMEKLTALPTIPKVAWESPSHHMSDIKKVKKIFVQQAQQHLIQHLSHIQEKATENWRSLAKTDLSGIIDTTPKTDREKSLFGDIIQNATVEELRAYRTTGICAGDEKAKQWVKNLATKYSSNLHAVKLNNSVLDGNLYGKGTRIRELQSIMEDYIGEYSDEIDPKLGVYENNEVKCKITSVNDTEFEKISQMVEQNWNRTVPKYQRMKYKIKGIYKIEELPVEKDFTKAVEGNERYSPENLQKIPASEYSRYSVTDRTAGGKNCQLDTFYHGTGSVATSMILGHEGQFKVRTAKAGRMIGNGIYLADMASKSAQYIGDFGYKESNVTGSLMVCEASLGKCFWNDGSDSDNILDNSKRLLGTKFDSSGLGNKGFLNDAEWCVHNPKAVKPKFLVEMEIEM